ncbi:TolB family protein [Nocardioides marmorisolisilvae]|uniref:Uncharacterized protein n=1 Tax=Nocardioides marmorisolisilvae TaxID=1542737 RepID=A0A3N0DZ68_9ACTN|nr:PD40 domain-containing protein [Nocardioides marmorisolisilvae]RNL80900.1 hypothetical protein EFL95_00480 [Nocardioides marmorisolisilvae]
MKRLLVLVVMTALVVGGCAGGGSETPSGQHTTSLAGPRDPDGRIALRRFVDDAETSAAIYVLDADGTDETRLTRPAPGVIDDEPDWSPDGTSVVFTRTTAGAEGAEARVLCTISVDGSAPTQLSASYAPDGNTSIAGWDIQGAFSPDGKLLAFAHLEGLVAVGGTHGIPEGSDQIESSEIWVMNADGTHRRQVTRHAAYSGDSGGVAWSPDGSKLVYSRFNSAAAHPRDGRALFVVDLADGHERRLTPWSLGAGGTPEWSPATNLIAFRAVQDEESGIGNFFTVRPDGTGLTQVTHFVDTVISHKIGFSPDGAQLVFGKTGENGSSDIFTANLDGSDLRPVATRPQSESSADWGAP